MNTITRTNLLLADCQSVEELIQKVRDWGREKKINNPAMQFAKINEEIGELAHELTRGNCGVEGTIPSLETVDAIGDILVTVIIMADIIGVEPISALAEAYKTISKRKGETKNGSFVKEEN